MAERSGDAPLERPVRLVADAAAGMIDVGAGAPSLLPDGPFVWRVEGGAAEIYLDEAESRCLLALIPEGGHVLAMPHGARAELVVVGEPGARLVADTLGPEAVDGWILAVARALRLPRAEAAPAILDLGGALQEGQWHVAPREMVTWVLAARMSWCLEDNEPRANVLPIAGGMAVRPLSPARGIDSATLQSAGRLSVSVAGFMEQLPGLLARLRHRADARDLEALIGDGLPGGGASDLPSPVAVIAEALGIMPRVPLSRERRSFTEAPVLLHHVGLRARRVMQRPGWSGRDAGPILAEGRESRDAVALVWRQGAYRRADGRAVTAADEAAFTEAALAVHAPLPDRVRGILSLALHLAPSLRRDGAMAAAAGAGASAIGVLTPLATGWILSDIVPSGLPTLLFAIGLALFAGAFITTVFSAARGLALERIAGRTGLEVATAVADKILRLPPAFFRDYAAGDLNQRIAAIDQLGQLVTGVMLSAGLTLIFSVFYFVSLVVFDPGLAGLAFVLVLIYVAATFAARALQLRHARRAAELDGKVSGATYETLAGIGKLRVAAAEERALERWHRLYRAERRAAVRMGRIGAHFTAFSDSYQTVALMTLFAVAAMLTARDLPAGHFIGFLVAFGAFQGAFIGFCDGLMSLFAAQPLAERARPILAAQAEANESKSDPGRLSGAIELSGLAFSYPGGRPLLESVDLAIRSGEHIAIVGGSGSGKSTILRLLLGFETPVRGTITYDGQELSRLDLARVRAQIGVVMQSSQLFAGSIFENIRGASDAGLEACMNAADAAGLTADLAGFPMGLHTPVTEGAGSLSGGQRQRILIARALVGNPPIQLLDEATSALDNTTQAVVMRALEASSATRIVIAHRLSTVRGADRICVLKDGRFAETGTYEELIARNGAFAALAQRQLLEG